MWIVKYWEKNVWYWYKADTLSMGVDCITCHGVILLNGAISTYSKTFVYGEGDKQTTWQAWNPETPPTPKSFPCPHCGGTEIVWAGNNKEGYFYMECMGCGATGGHSLTVPGANNQWNKRQGGESS